MADSNDVQRILDLALRVGEMLLSNGAGAADVSATMSSLTLHLGLRNVTVDVTFTSLNLTYQPHTDELPYSLTRHVTHREIDYDDLTRVDHLVRRLLTNRVDLTQARIELARLAATGHQRPRWAITTSWGVIGGSVGLLLGGDWIVVLVATVAALGINVLGRWFARGRLPFFYQQAAGGLFATLLVVLLRIADIPVDPSLVVTASIIMLLAGLGFIGAIQDALTGFYLTASARLLEVSMATIGIIVGVGGGLNTASVLGVSVVVEPGRVAWSHLPIMVFGAGLCAAAFAYSVYVPIRALPHVGLIGGAASLVYFGLFIQGFQGAWASALAATVIGLLSYGAAARSSVPPLAIVVPAILPLLPGLSIYRSLSLIAEGQSGGVLAMATAAGIAIALAAGVILGEYIAQPLGGEVRRLERRLSGPRLVGPLRNWSRQRRNRRRGASS